LCTVERSGVETQRVQLLDIRQNARIENPTENGKTSILNIQVGIIIAQVYEKLACRAIGT
jgi:hypothetical protein